MAKRLICLIQNLQYDCEICDSASVPIKERLKESSSSRVNRALDALADVFVSDKSGVFAIAARMIYGKVMLTISTNTSARENEMDHIHCICEHLNALGNEYMRRIQQQQKCPPPS